MNLPALPLSARFYRTLVRFYPEAFRREFAGDLLLFYLERRRETLQQKGFAGLFRFWMLLVNDWLVSLLQQHARARRRSQTARFRPPKGDSPMSQLLSNLRFALRSWKRQPVFTLAILIMLALGIAGNTAIFSLVNGLLLKPLPFHDPEQLVYLDETAPRWNLEFVSISYPDFHGWVEGNRSFEYLAAFNDEAANVSFEGQAERIKGASVTWQLAQVLGLKPLLGRDLAADDDRVGAAPTVLISEGLWQRFFERKTDILGRPLSLDGTLYSIIGVLPRQMSLIAEAEFWVPLAADPSTGGGTYFLKGIGRLKRETTLVQARLDLEQIQRGRVEEKLSNEAVSPVILPFQERFIRDLRPVSYLLMAAVVLVLLIACGNVASLMLARALARRREIGLRAALGAGRLRIVFQLLLESIMLATVGGAAGILLGIAALKSLTLNLPEGLPPWLNFDVDYRVILFCLTAAAAAAIISGLMPAMQASRTDLHTILAESGTRSSASAGKRRILGGLVMFEVALAAVLLVGAGLLMQAFDALQRVDPGFNADRVLVFDLALPESRYDDAAQTRFYRDLVEKINAIPGASSAAVINHAPLGGHTGNFFDVENAAQKSAEQQDPVVLMRIISPGYLTTLGIGLREGRSFEERDGLEDARGTIIVNETFARHYFPEVSALGQRIRFRGAGDWMEIVGVSRDVKHYGLDREMRPGVYLPLGKFASNRMTVVVKGAVDPLTLLPETRALIQAEDPELPLYAISPLSHKLEESLWVRRTTAWLFGLFAFVSLILAAGGIYGILSYSVGQQLHEIGIRMALGAQTGQVLQRVLWQGFKLVITGVSLGMLIALLATRFLSSILFEVSPRDPLTFTAVALFLVAVALFATFLPALRAARVDPVRALRYE